MSRSTRIEFPGAIYHVMSRGVGRTQTFHDDGDRWNFLGRIEKTVEAGDLEVFSFCLMPNHYHLLLRTPRGGLSRWMKCINGEYAQWFNFKHDKSGYLWQGRYKALLVEGGKYLLDCSRYIHLNPNRALLTRPAERWRWSSYRNYIRTLGRPVVPWIETGDILEILPTATSAKNYREYVESAEGEKPVSPFERATAELILGSEAFVNLVKESIRSRRDSGEEPALRRLRALGMVDPSCVEEEIDKAFSDLPDHRRRRLKLYGLWRWTSLNGAAAARRYGLGRGATTTAVKAVEKRMAEEAWMVSKLRKVGKRLQVSLPAQKS